MEHRRGRKSASGFSIRNCGTGGDSSLYMSGAECTPLIAILQSTWPGAEPLSGFWTMTKPSCKEPEGAPELEKYSTTPGSSMNIYVSNQASQGTVAPQSAKNNSRSFDALRSLRMTACLVLSQCARRVAVFALLAVLGLASAGLHAQSAKTDFKRGQSAEAK